jgi:hypothetical protein
MVMVVEHEEPQTRALHLWASSRRVETKATGADLPTVIALSGDAETSVAGRSP